LFSLLRFTVVLVALHFLSGCLQVELVGPVAGAKISITKLRGGPNLTPGLYTAGVSEAREVLSKQKWDKLDGPTQLLLLGGVNVPKGKLKNGSWYLVTATGGRDLDDDGNGKLEGAGRAVERELHAIVTGAQLKNGNIRVNLLTEAIYQDIRWELEDLGYSEIKPRLNETARRLVDDVNGEDEVNYADVLDWSAADDEHPYLGPALFQERMQRALYDDLYEEAILELDAVNLVTWAGLEVARKSSRYKNRLIGCATPVIIEDLCTFGDFPLLGMQSGQPTIDQIMARVLVSHSWMASRFRQVLVEMPEDILLLFRSVAVIVIDADIRPAHYDDISAGIFIDPAYLWQTSAEWETISQEEDYREEFADEVAFADLWRYVKDNDYAVPRQEDGERPENRSLDEVIMRAAPLLFHELAHAVDAFRPENLEILQPWELTIDTFYYTLSEELEDNRPLNSKVLFGVANVLYKGFSPTTKEASYSASQIGNLFGPDGATDLYAYNSIYEDSAMLFEEAMMAIHYGVQRDMAFASLPDPELADEDISCADYVVSWGARGRLTAPVVLPRVKQVVNGLLPERSYNGKLNQLPKPLAMNKKKDWCDNLVLGEAALARSASAVAASRKMSVPPRHGSKAWR